MKSNHKVIFSIVIIIVVLVGVIGIKNRFVFASWDEDENGIRYMKEDGEFSIGFNEVDGVLYYFDDDGYLKTGKIYISDEDSYYYADENGAILSGEIRTGNEFYVTDETGKIKTGFVDYDGARYFFNANAELVYGWFKSEDDWYYSDEQGVVSMGFATIDGYRYYFGEDGVRVSDTVMDIDGVTYIFNSDGSVDENATQLYPVYQYLLSIRKSLGLNVILLDSKINACAIIRAAALVEGFAENNDGELETLIKNRGVESGGGYEFSYGGIDNYGTEQLIEHIKLDNNINEIIKDEAIQSVGLGVCTKNEKSYYDIIFVIKP